jgi:dihydrofolate synthase/folylpolyglutamate synthase
MNYQEALDYILKFADYERQSRSNFVWDLRRIERLLERLGNPQYSAKTVHITGTKGKESAAVMVESVLRLAGYKTGLYTSPHLLSFTERIKADGQPISEDDWARLTRAIMPEVEIVNAEGAYGELTTFEILTALGFLYFREMEVDYQLIEVGLGGRLDATNVVKPDVCVMTSISYDHTDVLGNTLAEIAGEKAGIIKPGAVVVTAPQEPEAMAVIEKVCSEKSVRLIKAGSEVTWRKGRYADGMQSFQVKGLVGEYDLKIPLPGEYQMENAAVAVATIEVLIEQGAVKITIEDITEGFKQVSCPGRLQVLHREPLLVVDEAHNAYSMKKLGEALREYFEFDKLIMILGFGWDKEVDGMVRIADDIIVVASTHPKAVKPEMLREKFCEYGISARTAESVPAAVEIALTSAGKKDLICAAGSIFVVAEVVGM